MKLIILILALTHLGLVQADTLGTPSLFYKGETKPGHKTIIELAAPHCMIDSSPLIVDRKDSVAGNVRYVYLVGRLSGMHKSCADKLKDNRFISEIERDPKRVTQYFISIESPGTIVSVKDEAK